MSGIAKFVLGRYWKLATDDQKAEFQKLLETLLVQSYAKAFAHYSGEKFDVGSARGNDDGSMLVNSTIIQPNGDVIHLDWRVEDGDNTLKITDLLVEGVSLRTTHRSDFASAIQSNGGTVAGLRRDAPEDHQRPVAAAGSVSRAEPAYAGLSLPILSSTA